MTSTQSEPKTILVVEDDFFIRDMLVELLEEEGYTVQGASNGAEALQLLSSSAELPALILLDLMMPVMDGRLFRLEQQRDPRIEAIPVVVLTASSDTEPLPDTFAPAAYVPKPINLQNFLDTVSAIYNPALS